MMTMLASHRSIREYRIDQPSIQSMLATSRLAITRP
jgi:hypothetical protein